MKAKKYSLDSIREHVLFGIIIAIVFVGIFAYIPSIIGSLNIGYIDTIIIDTLFYFAMLYLLFNKKLSLTQRTIGLIVSIWILSLYLIIRFGILGAGFLWIGSVPVLVGLLLGLKKGILSLIVNLIIFIITGSIVYLYSFSTISQASSMLTWLIISGNSLAVSALLMVSSSIIIERLHLTLDQLNSNIKELELTQYATMEIMATLAEFRDTETGDHILRTQSYVLVIANHLSLYPHYYTLLTPEYIKCLGKSATLHDIGKIGVPDNILLKQGKLTSKEFEIMKKHTIYGRDALLNSQKRFGDNYFLALAAEIAYTHQERWDGSGYPEALRDTQIPLSGRIMAVADVYDALMSTRPYKKAFSHEEAINYLEKNSGILFDPEIIELLPKIGAEFKAINSTFMDK